MPPPASPASAPAGPAVELQTSDYGVLVATLILPGLALIRLAPARVLPWIGGWIAFASLAAYFLHARDKRRAARGEWRTPEAVLHSWTLIGGWPGAWIAQRRLRHKNAKFRFQLVQGLIVLFFNYVALECLLRGRLMRSAFGALRSLFTAATT